MKLNHILILFVFVLFILSSCSIFNKIQVENPNINLEENIDSTSIFVLPFSKRGNFLPPYSGSLFSNKLSDNLYLSKKFSIVDNSILGNLLEELDISKSSNFSHDEMIDIGLLANADYIIVGHILQYTDTELISLEDKRKLSISGRILNVRTESISGVININSTYEKANIVEVFELMSKKIVDGLITDDI